MKIETVASDLTDTARALEAVAEAARGADFVFAAANADHPAAQVQAGLSALGIGALHGASSCRGAMSAAGHSTKAGLTLFVLRDAAGDYGTGRAAFGADGARGAAQRATEAALAACAREGEVPDVLWVTATPGAEEAVLQGIEDTIGTAAPIIGGSAADNAVAGAWYVLDGQGTCGDGVVVTAMFPSVPVSYAHQNGYAPTGQAGRVTRADGRRMIEIDGAPAFDVLQEWSGGALPSPAADADANILSAATLWPLGRSAEAVQGIPTYLLAHPATADASGAVTLFADVAEGEAITQMTGTTEALAARAGRVAAQAMPRSGAVAGALMVYCGGCMLSLRDKLDVVTGGTAEALGGAPFLGFFSFGEQGPMAGSGNRHGNLMISCLVFGAS